MRHAAQFNRLEVPYVDLFEGLKDAGFRDIGFISGQMIVQVYADAGCERLPTFCKIVSGWVAAHSPEERPTVTYFIAPTPGFGTQLSAMGAKRKVRPRNGPYLL